MVCGRQPSSSWKHPKWMLSTRTGDALAPLNIGIRIVHDILHVIHIALTINIADI